jgi:hypothetical protein
MGYSITSITLHHIDFGTIRLNVLPLWGRDISIWTLLLLDSLLGKTPSQVGAGQYKRDYQIDLMP